MASVLKKLVRRDARNANDSAKSQTRKRDENNKDEEQNGPATSTKKGQQAVRLKEADDKSMSPGSSHSAKPCQELAEMSASHAQRVRTKRLMKEFHDCCRKCDSKIFTAELVNDNLYEWNIKLHKIDTDSMLNRDLLETGTKFILLNVSFPENFPFAPPFMRVLAPRIEGGFVLDGGAICMELLTPKGWSSAYTVEAIILQFSAAVVKGKGRIDRSTKKAFSKKEAEQAYKRLVKTHEKYGWVTPPKAEG